MKSRQRSTVTTEQRPIGIGPVKGDDISAELLRRTHKSNVVGKDRCLKHQNFMIGAEALNDIAPEAIRIESEGIVIDAGPLIAIQKIVARTANNVVVPLVAEKRVIPAATVNSVASYSSVNDIITIRTEQTVSKARSNYSFDRHVDVTRRITTVDLRVQQIH